MIKWTLWTCLSTDVSEASAGMVFRRRRKERGRDPSTTAHAGRCECVPERNMSITAN
ncbi:MAG: hypothetical protein MJA29_14525 [Candidatus Omnitrophica bacterium]|nr:hypothetical protein [Candidatus Omnitrophota bacterium]